jgi:membrane protein involved in colicin uptake
MTAVYHGRGEKMEGYELYRLSDEEIQHVGVKGMKWGKRKSRSAYMKKVDKHEAKTKANRQKVADHKAREKEQGKAVAKAVGKKYMGAVAKHEAKTASKREAKAVKGAARKQLAKARAKDLSDKLSKGLNVAVAVNDVYGDISPTGLKNHFANAEQLEKYGIEYNP